MTDLSTIYLENGTIRQIPARGIVVTYDIILNMLRRMLANGRGVAAPFLALALPVIVGAVGLATEVTLWYLTQRNMQNAADSAVLAASANAGSTYAREAKAAAAQYGFVDGSNNVSVAASNTAPCPAGGNTCYSVTITGSVPVMFSRVIGYNGKISVQGVGASGLSGLAMASQATP